MIICMFAGVVGLPASIQAQDSIDYGEPFGPLEEDASLPGESVLESQPMPAEAASGGDSISEVPAGTVVCNTTITFTGQGALPPGTNYDGILTSGEATFAERFVGQTRTTVGSFDALDNVASNPLTLQVGVAGQNVNVLDNLPPQGDVVDGLGPLGYPYFEAIGEGSLAMLFGCDQFELRLVVVGGEEGTATLQFFRGDGSHIGNVVIATSGKTVHGFRRTGNVADIRGVSIYNDDPAGVGYDDICLTSCATPVESGTWGRIKARYSQ